MVPDIARTVATVATAITIALFYRFSAVTVIGNMSEKYSYSYSDMLVYGDDVYVALIETQKGGAGHQKVRIFKSSDGGENWTEKGTVIEGTGFHGWVRLRK